MPIYLYRCSSCGETTEALQKAGDPPLTDCPECGRNGLRKVIAPVGVIFKGSGFHVTDYGRGGRKPEASKDSKPEKKKESRSNKSEPRSEGKVA